MEEKPPAAGVSEAEEESVCLPTDPAAGAPPPGVGALPPGVGAPPPGVGAAVGAPPPQQLPPHPRWRHAGDADLWHPQVTPSGTDVFRVGGGATAAAVGVWLVAGEQEQVVHVDLTRLPEGVVLLGGNAGRVALSAAHHLEGRGQFKSLRSVCVYLLGPGRLVAAGRLVLVVVQLLLVLRRPLRVLLLLLLLLLLLQRHQVRTLLLQLPLQPLGLPLVLDLLPLVLLHIRARRRRAVYGYTPNQSAPGGGGVGLGGDAANRRAPRKRVVAQATSDISRAGNRRKGNERGGK
ncbi:hypothetical protein EYF80_048630 [Liparis tanakae]|uniref:Uncharacterized protein n=1 Tax=Liparis tanakae TaxID=230148 RepID=A0A4Z2FLP7_9TELE|nr:hypothetical protein EYF80_048630 [Liparis tanakae]